MEGPLSDLPIHFPENRANAARLSLVGFVILGMVVWAHWSFLSTPAAWAGYPGTDIIPYVAPLLEATGCLALIMSLSRLVRGGQVVTLGAEGLRIAGIGLIPWEDLGPVTLSVAASGRPSGKVLRVELRGATAERRRQRAISWLFPHVYRREKLFAHLEEARFTCPIEEVLAAIEAHRWRDR